MNSLIKWLLDVLLIFYLLIGLALVFRTKKNLRNVLIIISGLWLFIIYISPLPIIITENREREYSSFKISEHSNLLNDSILYIIVLGAGYENDPEISSTAKLSNTVAVRLIEAIRIYRNFPNAKLVTSGAEVNQKVSQADAVANAAIDLGVNKEDTLQLSNTYNTRDEAENFLKRFGNENRVIVVTDAVHMKRAIKWVQYYGINAIAAPTNYYVKNDPDFPENRWIPSFRKIQMLNAVIREWVGLWGVGR